VFVPGKGVVLNEPSVVAVSEIDHRILAVGFAAKEMIGRTPGEIVAYRPLRDGVLELTVGDAAPQRVGLKKTGEKEVAGAFTARTKLP